MSIRFRTQWYQQKKRLLPTDRHCVRMQEIPLEHPVRPAHTQRAQAEWLHPSPLGAIHPASCPPSPPEWAISHRNLPKKTNVATSGGLHWGSLPAPDHLYLQRTTSSPDKGCSNEKDLNIGCLTIYCPGNDPKHTPYFITTIKARKRLLSASTPRIRLHDRIS